MRIYCTSKVYQRNMTKNLQWQPNTSFFYLQARAALYQQIRAFFLARDVLEVETPALSKAAVPDCSITPFATQGQHPELGTLYLHTSPELPMKRLLAAGSGAIYQLCKVFRDDEIGRFHNPEFTLLEWYRPDFDDMDLIAEVDQLLQEVLNTSPAEIYTYTDIFQKFTPLDPLFSPLETLQDYAQQLGLQDSQIFDRDGCLQFIMAIKIEPQLGHTAPCVIRQFPASQAALARKCIDDPRYAARFEFYVKGIELANGFYELTDAIEQRQRFEADCVQRDKEHLPALPIDEHFLAALEAGLPDCAGVALGVDRLLMLQQEVKHIQEVIAFPTDKA